MDDSAYQLIANSMRPIFGSTDQATRQVVLHDTLASIARLGLEFESREQVVQILRSLADDISEA
jgi:hypothetical protein